MRHSLVVSLALIFFSQFSFSQSEPQAVLTSTEAPRIQGIWKSEASRALGAGVHFTEEMQFTLARWERTVFFSSTADMKKIILIARSEGPYELKKSPDEKTAWQLDLKVARRALNLQQSHPALLKALHLSGCSLGKKKETQINNGCGIFTALEKCPVEYQIVDTKEGRLHMAAPAATPADFINGFCDGKKRPTFLDFSMKRVN